MSRSNFIAILFLTLLTLFSSCKDDEIVQADSLEEFGILGKWGLQSITINGITDMSIRYDTIEFKADSDLNDLKGEFSAYGVQYETNGMFELMPSNKTIEFNYGDKQKLYEFQLAGDLITFTYFEEQLAFIESWRKAE